MSETCEILPSCRPLLETSGLINLVTFMETDSGRPVSDSKDADVRRLKPGEGAETPAFFLKRRFGESVFHLLGMVFYGRWPRSGPLRERMLVCELKASGFDVMEPAAWGERRVWGFPRAGFLLVREIEGRSMADLFSEASGHGRLALMRELGKLVGRLHHAGFLQPVRLKDLIRAPDGRLVLIDRESSKPWPKKFTVRAGIRSLARAARRTLRDGHRLGPGAASGFLSEYRRALGDKMSLDERRLRKELMTEFRAEMGGQPP